MKFYNLKDCESQMLGKTGQNSISWTWKDPCTHELTAVVAACTKLVQDQARHHSSMEERLMRSYREMIASVLRKLFFFFF